MSSQQSFKFFFVLPKFEFEDSEPPRLGFEVTKRLNFTISIYWQGRTIPNHLDWHRKEEKEHLKGKQNICFYLLWIFKPVFSYTLTHSHKIQVDIMSHLTIEADLLRWCWWSYLICYYSLDLNFFLFWDNFLSLNFQISSLMFYFHIIINN